MELRIVRELPAGCEQPAASLYWEAFGRKLGIALGPREHGTDFIAQHLNHDRAAVALRGQALVGVAGFHLGGRSFVGGGARDVVRSYGFVRSVHRLALLSVLERPEMDGELLMDGIAVVPSMRGQGIGERLLAEIAAVASETGHATVRLDVVDTNSAARRLYERVGFVAGATRRVPALGWLLGFRSATSMRLAVGHD